MYFKFFIVFFICLSVWVGELFLEKEKEKKFLLKLKSIYVYYLYLFGD